MTASTSAADVLSSQLQSPSHYSNRAREKRCTRAKELLVELIKTQTTHHVDPKDVKTTKPSSAVSWRFEVEPGIEFPFVQLSSISRPNLDLLEKAVEGGGVRVVWMNETELSRSNTDEDGRFSDSKRPRKRIKHSADSDHAPHDAALPSSQIEPPPPQQQSQQVLPISQGQAITPPQTAAPLTSFTTVNGPIPQPNNHIQQQQQNHHHSQNGAEPPVTSSVSVHSSTSPTSSSSDLHHHRHQTPTYSEPTVSVDIPLRAIARILDAERDSINEKLRTQNTVLIAETDRMRSEIANIQSKYNALEEQLRKKMSQIQEILEGKKADDEGKGGGYD